MPIPDDHPFAVYLREKGLSYSTQALYVSHIERLMRHKINLRDPDMVSKYIETECTLSTRGSIATAVKHFRVACNLDAGDTAAESNRPFSRFAMWLRDKGYAVSTSALYSRYLLTLLNRMKRGETPAMALRHYERSPVYLSTWRRYLVFLDEHPEERPDFLEDAPSMGVVPAVVGRALHRLERAGWQMSILHRASWADVTWRRRTTANGDQVIDAAELHDAETPETSFETDRTTWEAFETLYRWACPDHGALPLVPSQHRGKERLSRIQLRRLVDQAELDLQAGKEGRAAAFPAVSAPSPKEETQPEPEPTPEPEPEPAMELPLRPPESASERLGTPVPKPLEVAPLGAPILGTSTRPVRRVLSPDVEAMLESLPTRDDGFFGDPD